MLINCNENFYKEFFCGVDHNIIRQPPIQQQLRKKKKKTALTVISMKN